VNKQDSDLRMCLTFLMGLTTNNEVRWLVKTFPFAGLVPNSLR
jgi:hypothetical protein